MTIHHVSLLGCGWLGSRLATTLMSHDYHVNGSVSQLESVSQLHDIKGLQPYVIDLSTPFPFRGKENFFDVDCLIVMVPFKRDLVDPWEYLHWITELVNFCSHLPLSTILFTSSTSVYPDDGGVYTEQDVFLPSSTRSEVLLACEQVFLTMSAKRIGVFRFGGLFGDNRDSSRVLNSGQPLTRQLWPVNLVHVEDCVQVLYESVQQDISGVYNVVSDGHPTRDQYYTARAKALDIMMPECLPPDDRAKGKTVLNDRLKKDLSYTFIQADPLLF